MRRRLRAPLAERAVRAALVVTGAAIAGCGGGATPGGAPMPPPPPPSLSGLSVMLFPVQTTLPAADLAGELAFWLSDRASDTRWVSGEDLAGAVERTPGWRVDVNALPPGVVEVDGRRQLRDPLYGLIRTLSSLTDARYALIPYARRIADSTGIALEMTGVLVDAHGGHVLWVGTVRGEPAGAGEPLHAASAAEALARALAPL